MYAVSRLLAITNMVIIYKCKIKILQLLRTNILQPCTVNVLALQQMQHIATPWHQTELTIQANNSRLIFLNI